MSMLELIVLVLFQVTCDQVSSQSCGQRMANFHLAKIVGGTDTLPGEVPWQTSLQMKRSSGYRHYCGGSVIHEEWILTAAHCLDGQSISKIRAVVGTNNLKSGGQIVQFDIIFVHPQYDANTVSNDIAMAHAARPMNLTTMPKTANDVSAVCLPTTPNGPTSRTTNEITLTGFGLLHETDTEPSLRCQTVAVRQLDSSLCQSAYQNFQNTTMMCGGYAEGGRDSCSGDSGGPATVTSTTTVKGSRTLISKTTQMGITSFGAGCARPNAPGVYTKVFQFMPWIRQTVQNGMRSVIEQKGAVTNPSTKAFKNPMATVFHGLLGLIGMGA